MALRASSGNNEESPENQRRKSTAATGGVMGVVRTCATLGEALFDQTISDCRGSLTQGLHNFVRIESLSSYSARHVPRVKYRVHGIANRVVRSSCHIKVLYGIVRRSLKVREALQKNI